MDVNIYNPSPALAAILKSSQMRAIVFEVAEVAQALYVAQVVKRTGMLASSAHASTEIGGMGRRTNDRWVGVLTVGGTGALGTVDYAASHEFGVKAEIEGPASPKLGKRGKPLKNQRYEEGPVFTGGHHAAHDLNRVLEELGGL